MAIIAIGSSSHNGQSLAFRQCPHSPPNEQFDRSVSRSALLQVVHSREQKFSGLARCNCGKVVVSAATGDLEPSCTWNSLRLDLATYGVSPVQRRPADAGDSRSVPTSEGSSVRVTDQTVPLETGAIASLITAASRARWPPGTLTAADHQQTVFTTETDAYQGDERGRDVHGQAKCRSQAHGVLRRRHTSASPPYLREVAAPAMQHVPCSLSCRTSRFTRPKRAVLALCHNLGTSLRPFTDERVNHMTNRP
eukprot:813935-Amphidinium_carterae.1